MCACVEWIRLLKGYQNGAQRSHKRIPPKVPFSIYAHFNGNHIQNMDFVKSRLVSKTLNEIRITGS
ncbi:hypothetical protein SBF1_270003 [Candidatus Desulfosporosinus infrequens]|uniref:Uncharacterized protein n=1 Tax=Candidatus Desulfosporosinus infrequens TaxID=2043169 RepID=A0A2U3KTQ9_9FIRM|nr:hypothetical protein SBF1_270003 [Candidatus Desulfosporosinus infrequens]